MLQGGEPALTHSALLALGVTGLALFLFVWNRLRVDVVALVVMVALILTGLLTPQQAISGFAHEATVTVALVLVLAAGLVRTGAVDLVARRLAALAAGSEARLLVLTVLTVLPLSAVINNTAAVAVLMPVTLGVARSIAAAPSRLLMPLSFAGQLGGTLTLIGTSTNLLVAGLVLDLGVDRIRLFDITPPALAVCAAGVLYLLTVGRWLLPERDADRDLLQSYELHDYLTMLRVLPDSHLIGRSLAEARFGETHGLQVVRIQRGPDRSVAPQGSTILREGDVLVVQGKIAEIAKVRDEEELELIDTEFTLAGAGGDEAAPALAEVLVPRRAYAARQTLRQLALRARFQVSAIAMRRHGVTLQDHLGDIELQPGDMLLVQGTQDSLARLHGESDLVLLGAVDLPRRRRGRMKVAVPIVAGVVLLPALGITSILVSALMGVLAMFLTRCVTPDEAYRDMDWMIIILLGGILPLGIAMHESGAAAYLAHELIDLAGPLGTHGMLAVFLLLTTALTSILSNAAAAVVLAPIAVAVAASFGSSPLPFVIAVMIGASTSFLSPIGYQTNTMIYGPGGYRFSDYLRVGAPLSLLVIAVATFAIPVFFPF